MFPAFAHFRRTAMGDTELHGQQIRDGRQGGHVVRVLEPRRVALRGPRPLRRRAATPSTRPSARAGRHFCLGAALARLELQVLFEETLRRYPAMEIDGTPAMVESPFVNQLKTLPVRLAP